MSMLFAPITVLLIVAHLDPVNSRPKHTKYAEDEKKDYSWTEADGYEECYEFLKFRKSPKPKPLMDICKKSKNPCVPYRSLNTSGCGYGRRFFPPGNWVSTNIDLDAFNRHQKAFDKLKSYLAGNNSAGAHMDLDVPIIQTWLVNQYDRVGHAMMSFYVPEPYQSNPPESSDNDVEVLMSQNLRIYYRAYGGDIEDEGYYKQFDLLKRALEKEGIIFDPYVKIKAQYTDPGDGRQRQEAMLIEQVIY